MNKDGVKKILMSLRNEDNEKQINNVLGKIDLLSEEKLQQVISQIGNDEESVKKYLQEKLSHNTNNRQELHTPINKMFEYGTTENCIHLHMPVDLHEIIAKKGYKKTFDTVNLYLLDAIEKIRVLQKDNYYKFAEKDSIYMISPILRGREMKFLEALDFETHSYEKSELQDEKFVLENPEAMLAVDIFGKNTTVGTAKLGFDVINSKQWQDKRKKQIEQFKKDGVTLDVEDYVKNID